MTRQEAVREVVRRLVEYYQPERVYLIGSTARGEDRPDSDLDFLVVLPEEAKGRLWDGGIYRRLGDIPMSVDVVPILRSTFEARSNWLMSLPAIALREGKLEYDALAGAH